MLLGRDLAFRQCAIEVDQDLHRFAPICLSSRNSKPDRFTESSQRAEGRALLTRASRGRGPPDAPASLCDGEDLGAGAAAVPFVIMMMTGNIVRLFAHHYRAF